MQGKVEVMCNLNGHEQICENLITVVILVVHDDVSEVAAALVYFVFLTFPEMTVEYLLCSSAGLLIAAMTGF